MCLIVIICYLAQTEMKRIIPILVVFSLCLNVFFFVREKQRDHVNEETLKLHYYKDISYEEGLRYFKSEYAAKYPSESTEQKQFIVYRWDSLSYEFIFRDQMLVLDSMAAGFGKPRLEYVFVTEMEEKAAVGFLKRNGDNYTHVKMLYGMDNYISGLHNKKDLNVIKPKVVSAKGKEFEHNTKQMSLYVLMDDKGQVLHNNGRKYAILKDTLLFQKLKDVVSDKPIKVLN